MRIAKSSTAAATAACVLLLGSVASQAARSAEDRQSVEVLQDTVVNLLQALVAKGVITKEQADAMVKQAQEKAQADLAAARAAQQAQQKKEEQEGAIAVPYVPEIVQQKISNEVAKEVRPQVTHDVVQEAKKEGWGVPAALPSWVDHVRVAGDVTIRAEDDLYGHDNSIGCPDGIPYGNCTIYNFDAINAAGGISKAGVNAFLNINQDRERFRARARLGVDVSLTDSFSAGVRIATGSLQNPVSETQDLGNEFGRYTVGFDRVYIQYDGRTAKKFSFLTAIGGKFADPFFAPTELVYGHDVDFDGVAVTGRLGFGDGTAEQSHAWLTGGGFPVQEVPLVSKNDKWLVGAQTGVALRFGNDQHLTLAGAYYDFIHMQGIPNTLDSTLTNYTAPLYFGYGNSVSLISNSSDPTVQLFGLAANFRIADVSGKYVLPMGRYGFLVDAEGARNVGFNRSEINNLEGEDIAPRINGYVGDVAFGDAEFRPDWQWRAWQWQMMLGYRYVQRDAVLAALTDSDFHEGGTNAAGYFLRADFGLADDVWTRFRYMSGKEIDGPNYRVDVLQLDLNAQF
jgi:hypothetical protein